MTKEDIQNLVKLRSFVAEFYQTLEGIDQPAAVIQTNEVAGFCRSVALSIDDLIKPHVEFK